MGSMGQAFRQGPSSDDFSFLCYLGLHLEDSKA